MIPRRCTSRDGPRGFAASSELNEDSEALETAASSGTEFAGIVTALLRPDASSGRRLGPAFAHGRADRHTFQLGEEAAPQKVRFSHPPTANSTRQARELLTRADAGTVSPAHFSNFRVRMRPCTLTILSNGHVAG